MYPHLIPYVKVTLVEASGALLGPFAESLRSYVESLFRKRNINLKLDTAVQAVEVYSDPTFRFESTRAVLSDGTTLPFGTMVWSAGVKPVRFLQQFAPETKSKTGRILTDEFLRVKGHEGKVWAIGDCAEIENGCLPQLAQVAQQQANYVATILQGKREMDKKEFKFYSLGTMASVGKMKGIYDGSALGGYLSSANFVKFQGIFAWIAWRSAYWGKQISVSNKLLIPAYWLKAYVFGRDISRF